MKTAYLVNSPINNKYLSDSFGVDHDSCFSESNAFTGTLTSYTLNANVMAYATRSKAYDSAKNQGHLHGFEPIVVKFHVPV